MKIKEYICYLDKFYFSVEKGIIEKIEKDIYVVRCQDGFLLKLNKNECFKNKKELIDELKRKKAKINEN